MVCRSTQAEIQEYRAPLLCPMTRLRSDKWATRCEADIGPLVNQGWIQAKRYHCAKCSLLTSVTIPKAASLRICFSSPQTKAAHRVSAFDQRGISELVLGFFHSHFMSILQFFSTKISLCFWDRAFTMCPGWTWTRWLKWSSPINYMSHSTQISHPVMNSTSCFPSIELRYGGKHQRMEDRVWGTHLLSLTPSHCTVRGLGKGPSFIALLLSPSLGLLLGVDNNTQLARSGSSPLPHHLLLSF